jgi:hypothetical protein
MKTKYIIITIMIMVCGNIACKKKSSEPFGENVIRYKVNGKQIEVKGKFNPLNGDGVSFGGDAYNGLSFSLGCQEGNTYNRLLLVFPKTSFISTIVKTDTSMKSYLTCNIPVTNKSQQFNAYLPTAEYLITINNNGFISGSFNGKLYAFNLGPSPNDSIIITDGYFDIAK